MRKKLARVTSLVTIAALLTGCSILPGKQKEEKRKEGQIVNIYSFNEDFKGTYEAYAKDLEKKHNVVVNYISISNNDNAYQINLDEALATQNEQIDDDKVDLFLIEADYASKYTKSEYALDIQKDVGLTDADLKNQYQYTKDIVTADGKLKAVSSQATPGLFAYRRSIAKQVLGTDDPTEVQKRLSDWNSFNAVAKEMKKQGYYMLSGYDDAFRVFSNNMSAPWVQNDKINLDPALLSWIKQTEEYTKKGYNNKTTLWAPAWSLDQGPEGKVFGFFYSTWGINFTLLGNALEDKNGEAKVGNGIFGDYAVCEGPQPYYWGGTWMCAAKGTDNLPFIKDLMYRLTCDEKTMKKMTLDTQDYTNNTKAMEEIANSDYKSDFLGGQNHIKLFSKVAKQIDMKNVSDYDQALNEKLQVNMHEYFDGKMTEKQALDQFYKQIQEMYPELKR